jgi:hypothetical protein
MLSGMPSTSMTHYLNNRLYPRFIRNKVFCNVLYQVPKRNAA